MKERLDYAAISPEGVESVRALERHVRRSPLDRRLVELVKIRASQLNGCAYCLDMHTKDARALGETEQRLYTLSAWRETPFFDERERAALAWTEAVTKVGDGIEDALYASVREHFSEPEIVDLTFAVVAINGWNRLSVAFGRVPGTYQPRPSHAAGSAHAAARSG